MAHRSIVISLGIAALIASGIAPARGEPPVVVKPIASSTTTASGQPIRFPPGDARVTFSEYVIAPGARLPAHKHPYPRFAYVLAGTLSVTMEATALTLTYKPGDAIFEVIDQWHFAVNDGPEAVRLLVVDTLPDGAKSTIIKQ
ncbi:cupin domain-containing protein [Roseixanthobacter pseudopolyaromaticivorans]|uniref:cupin domain-containing protein n=1 Tax=Xanthobacteraceae TaxID=335928 RepID=UPI0037288543